MVSGEEMPQSTFELTYTFEKPILVRGYILQTADDGDECLARR